MRNQPTREALASYFRRETFRQQFKFYSLTVDLSRKSNNTQVVN